MMAYDAIPALSGTYLEDSFILSIDDGATSVGFELDVVLTEAHPAYRGPKPGEQYDFRRGTLRFDGVTAKQWGGRRGAPAVDASGETDYGNIDVLTYCETTFHLAGDFGSLDLTAESVHLDLFDV